jgi:hypothetical protein
MAELSGAKSTNGTASALIKTGGGKVFGVIVNSHTNGTMKLWDNTSAAGTVLVNTFTFPAGSGVYRFPEPIEFYTGLYFTLGGTLDFTIVYK